MGFRLASPSKSLFFLRPDLVLELINPDIAKLVGLGSSFMAEWYCKDCEKSWPATIKSRAKNNTGCPNHSRTGFTPSEKGILYFIKGTRNGIVICQYGITQKIDKRLVAHKRNGFSAEFGSSFLEFEKESDAYKIEQLVKNTLTSKKIYSIAQDPDISDKLMVLLNLLIMNFYK